MQQQAFAGFKKTKPAFGGNLLKGNAKSKRPLDSKKPLHLVLRSQHEVSLRSPKAFGPVNLVVKQAAEKYGVRIYAFANVGDHLHVLLKISNRRLWAAFIREIAGRIASLLRTFKNTQVWAHKPFTRVVQSWRRDFRNVKDYIFLNELEGGSVISAAQKRVLQKLRTFWSDGS